MRPGDPLDVQTGVPAALQTHRLKPGVVREHREIYIRGYIAGLAAPVRARRRRIAWVAVVLATIALVLTAFWAGRTAATPRPAQVIPSGSSLTTETDPERTGAPQSWMLGASGNAERGVPASGAPHPTAEIGEPASYAKPTPKPKVVSLGGIGGEATWWFSFGPGLYAALRPDLGTKGDLAIVCGGKPWHCLTLNVITTCACLGPGSNRLIDLSKDAFASFADPSVGTIHIVLQVVK